MGVLSSGLRSSLGGYKNIFSSDDEDDPLKSINRSIGNAESRLQSVNQSAEPKSDGNFLTAVLQNLGRFGYGSMNYIRELTDDKAGMTPGVFDPWQAFKRGFSLEETTTGKDVMESLGLNGTKGIFTGGDSKWYNPSLAGVLGLAADIVNPLDPVNWVTFGAGNTVKTTGVKGAGALSKSFGSKAGNIAEILGEDIVGKLGAPSVGKLMGQVGKEATRKGITGDALQTLLRGMSEGLEETGLKATSRLPYSVQKPITVGLQNPFTLGTGKTFGEVAIPGSEKLYGAASKAKNAFMSTKAGDALAKAFSTKHVPRNLPDTIVLRDITGRQMDDLIGDVEKGSFNSPLNRDELIQLKNELNSIPSINTTFDPSVNAGTHASFNSISQAIGMDPNLTRTFFETELPFTMDIKEIYQILAGNGANPTAAKELFIQSAKLRKVMDQLADSIPNELMPFFKGTVMTPNRIQSFEGSALNTIPQGTNESPMINYIFNHKGVDISAVINTSKNFNDDIWVKLGGTIRAIDELPAQNLQTLKDRIQVSPVTLGKVDGRAVQGYAIEDQLIVLGNPAKQVLPHEYGHVIQNASGDNLAVDYADAVAQDGGPLSSYARAQGDETSVLKEDFADAFQQYVDNPDQFANKYPARAQYIQNTLQNTQISPEELSNLMKEQSTRASSIINMPQAEQQVDAILAQVDNAIMDNISRGSILREGSEAYQEFRGELTRIFEESTNKVENFVKQVEVIFKDIPLEERKKIMETAATGYVGKVNMKTDYAPTWYTKTEKEVLPKMGNSMPVRDFRGLLKSQGVKVDEIRWLGLDDLLKEKLTITKAEVEEWLKWNNLEVQEITKSNALDALGGNASPTQYSQYTIPGGKDYQEMLFTLPQPVKNVEALREELYLLDQGFDPFSSNAQDDVLRMNELRRQIETAPQALYQSMHWQEPNVVAHTRFDTRYTPEGEKVLFIEEIQSDWHQAGREKGYNAETNTGIRLIGDKVNPAPFEKTWPEFVEKRLIRYAAENGFDRIAWTNGTQQAARYSLSNTVDRLIYHPEDQVLSGYMKGDRLFSEVIPENKLGDYIGKEQAVHIMKQTPDEAGQLVLQGADLDVGGAGMKGFYDRMVPIQFDKLGRKFGATVEPANILLNDVLSEQMSMKLTDSMKQSVLYEGQPLFKQGGEDVTEGLSEQGQQALNSFLKWRDSIVKEYRNLQIPIRELENYVPFIPVRGLKDSEQEALKTMFGTGMKSGEELDTLLETLSRTDPNLKERTTKATSPAEVNKVLGKEWLTEDAALAMALRGTRAIKAQEVAKFLDGFVGKYGLRMEDFSTTLGGKIPEGYKMYIIKTEENGKKLLQEVFNPAGIAEKGTEGFFIPEEMASVYNEYADLIFGVKAKNPILKLYDSATSAYKKVAYLWNPGHIPRDFIGNVFNGYLMGVVNPMEYVEAANLLRKPQTVIDLPSGRIMVQDLLDKAGKNGVLDVGASLAETPRDVIDRLNLPGRNPITNAVSKYSSVMRQGSKVSDTLTRFTGLIHELKAGKSFTEASAQVKKFYFDYFDLTPFERKVMKRIIPFYTWIRKNIPLQVEQLFKNPRNMARVGDVMNAASGGAIDWEDQPEYIRESAAFQLGSDGPYVAFNLPFTDLSKVPTNTDAVMQLLSSVNPLIRAPIESASNLQWFTGEPLEDYKGETRDIPLAGLLKYLGAMDEDQRAPQVDKRIVGNALDQIPLLRNIDVMTNPENTRRVSRTSSFIGGPAIYSEEGVRRSKLYEDKTNLETLIKQLQAQGIEIPTTSELKKSKGRSRIKQLLSGGGV